MGHNPNIVLLGATESSFRKIENFEGPVVAGLAVRRKSDGSLSVNSSDGALIGVSLGKDLSNTNRTPVVREGTQVPIRLKAGFTTPVPGTQVHVDPATGEAVASGGGAIGTNAVYESAMLQGRTEEDGSLVNCARIDLCGGL